MLHAAKALLLRFAGRAALLLLMGVAWPAHASFGDCGERGYLDEFDPRLNGIGYDCVERVRVPVPTGDGVRHIRLIHDRNADWILEESAVRQFERGVRESAAALAGMGRFAMDDITVLIADDFSPPSGAERFGTTGGWVREFVEPRGPECHVTLFLISFAGLEEFAASATAHEIFHCVQRASLSPEQRGSYGVGSGSWWVEGSAEWFASHAVTDLALLQDRVDAFDASSASTPLYQMEYEAIPFFLWYAQRHGADQVLTFLSGMADRRGAAAQMQAMQDALPAEEWLQFAQDYMDRAIRRPRGAALRFEPRQGDTWRWMNDLRERLHLEPFVLARNMIRIDCGVWGVQTNPLRAHATRTSRATAGMWETLPTHIDVRGGDPSARVLAGFNPTPSALDVTIAVDQQSGCAACAGSSQADACLIGTWRQVAGGSLQWLRDNMPAAARFQGESASTPELTLQADGGYRTSTVEASVSLQPGRSRTRAEGDAQMHAGGRWSTSEGQLHMCMDLQQLEGEVRLVAPGQTVRGPLPAPPVGETTMSYTCTGETLQTEQAMPGGRGRELPPMRTTYERVHR